MLIRIKVKFFLVSNFTGIFFINILAMLALLSAATGLSRKNDDVLW